jgi:hypothetical protein
MVARMNFPWLREGLLSPAAADAEQEFHRGPVDKRARKGLKLPDDIADFAARLRKIQWF